MVPSVFVNRTLNLRKIKYIGVDMDHTLVRYNTRAFEELAHKTMLRKLIQNKGYPELIKNLDFDFDKAIRGLVVDEVRGNILKLSRHGAIRASYHGTRPLDFQTQQKNYSGTYVDLSDPHYSAVDTAFSISVAVLFSQLVDIKDQNPQAQLPEFKQLYEDVVGVLDESHRDGSLKSEVARDLNKYIVKDPKLVESLERYRKHDKKIFILTNSDFHYTKLLLDYSINPYLKEHKNWQELFFLVITAAQKPRFFFDNLHFLKVNPEDGSMTNFDEPLLPGIFQGGCASIFERDLNVAGDDILYVGDHIYGDILRLKKDSKWRTALVVEELGEEIKKLQLAQPLQEEIQKLMDEKEPLEFELVQLISENIETNSKKNEPAVEDLQKRISEIDQKLGPIIKKQASIFNPYWGEVMRAGNEESYFAHQVDRFADIYMTTLADLLSYSPRTYFRAQRRPLAHELALSLFLSEGGG